MRHLILLILLLHLGTSTLAQSCWFNDTIRTQNELDDFIENYGHCETLHGAVLLYSNSSDPITNLQGLSFLKNMFGPIELVQSEVINALALNGLEGGYEIIFKNNKYLEFLPTFPEIKHVKKYEILNNPSLKNITIEGVIDSVIVQSQVDTLLFHISSPSRIVSRPVIRISADSSYLSITGIQGNPFLSKLDITCEELSIHDKFEVDSINLLVLSIKKNQYLEGLESIVLCNRIILDSCDNLLSLDFIADYSDIYSVGIINCPRLEWRDVKLSIDELKSVAISSSGFKSMKGLSEISKISLLRLLDLNLHSLEMTGLKEIDRNLTIGNCTIESIPELDQIEKEKIQEITLFQNPNLTDCNSICPYLSHNIWFNIYEIGCAQDLLELEAYCQSVSTSQAQESRYQLFPNPSTGSLSIQCQECSDGENFSYTVYNIHGQKVKSGSSNWNTTVHTGLSSGLYLFEIQYGGEAVQQRLVIE